MIEEWFIVGNRAQNRCAHREKQGFILGQMIVVSSLGGIGTDDHLRYFLFCDFFRPDKLQCSFNGKDFGETIKKELTLVRKW